MEIITKSHEENWKVCKALEEKGFVKIADCFWCKIFVKEQEKIVVTFDYVI